MGFFVGISRKSKLDQTFRISHAELAEFGINPEDFGVAPGESLGDGYHGSALRFVEAEKGNLEENAIRGWLAEKCLHAEIGPAGFYNEGWHDDELKYIPFSLSYLKSLVNRGADPCYKEALVQLEEAIERVADGRNKLGDFPKRTEPKDVSIRELTSALGGFLRPSDGPRQLPPIR
jgi:hypothetical protein